MMEEKPTISFLESYADLYQAGSQISNSVKIVTANDSSDVFGLYH